jgi:hypothetical protein
MKSPNHFLSLFGALAFAITGSAQAVVYFESIDGDLSGDNNAPTILNFSVGNNVINGVMGDDEFGVGLPLDRDFFTFTIDPGEYLTAINVTQYQLLGGSGSFYAISAGTSITIDSTANHLSNHLVNGLGDILPALDAGSYSGGLGLDAPLGPGEYTVWFQETSALIPYQIEYVVTAVPEPSTAMFGVIFGIAAVARRRRGHSPC